MTYKNLSPNFAVEDVNKTVDFYTNVLGFSCIMTVPEEGQFVWAMVQADGLTIMFQEQKNLIEEYPQLEKFSIGGSLTFYINVTDIQKQYDNLNDKVTIAKDLHTTFYGATDFAIEDCNGYILTFSQSAD